MLRRPLILLALFVAALSGFLPVAMTAATRQFNQHGLAFNHPADWKVTSAEEIPGGHLIFVEDPTEGITGIAAFTVAEEITLKEYTDICINNMSAEMPPGAKIKVTGRSAAGTMSTVKLLLTVQGTDLPLTMNVSKHRIGGLQVFCFTQIADEDRHLVQAGFDLIRGSLAAGK